MSGVLRLGDRVEITDANGNHRAAGRVIELDVPVGDTRHVRVQTIVTGARSILMSTLVPYDHVRRSGARS